MKALFALVVAGSAVATAQAQVVLSEVLGSTGGIDAEFIEIANIGGTAINITGWQIELWDSDVGGTFGGSDGGAPYLVSGNVTLQPGQTYVWGNPRARNEVYAAPNPTSFNGQPFRFDANIPSDGIENSAYTIILANNSGAAVDGWFFPDNDGTNQANRAGTPFVPSVIVPLDGGAFLNSGWALGPTGGFDLNFNTPGFAPPTLNNGTLAGGTPGINQIPTPGALALVGLGGLVAARRRRA